MESASRRRVPWKSWSEFTGWAQDFSLRQKVLGGFLAVVIVVGLVTSLVGTKLARDTIFERARMRLYSDLAMASFMLKSSQENIELKVRLSSGSDKLAQLLQSRDIASLNSRLSSIAEKNGFDFLVLVDEKGSFLAGNSTQAGQGINLSADPLLKSALKGKEKSGIRVIPNETVFALNPKLSSKIDSDKLKSTMVIEAAHPVFLNEGVIGALFGGILLNTDRSLVENISLRLFRGEIFDKREVGFVTIFQGDQAISSSLKDKSGVLKTGFRADEQVRRKVLAQGESEITWETWHDELYLAAAEPIRDGEGKIVGAIQVATLEKPITDVIHGLVATFLTVALIGVLLMGAITYFLVKWINRPLEQMLHAARNAAQGDLSHEVPVIARDEIGELAATFNLMIRNLAESRSRLEEWGKELASKVAVQTGELNQAMEQVARVKKLASLEKMADGMAHIMAHISDPLVTFDGHNEETGTTTKILVLDSDENVLEICRRIFESEGFEVTITRSVSEALDELEKEFYEVVIADVDMPEMGGLELLKEIKGRQPEVIVIMTAPFKATETAVETVKLGAFDYIPKPFGPHQILLMVYTALQGREMLAKTRKQHAEQRAELIFQRLPVAIALADKAHRVVYHNRAFLELAGIDGEETVKGRTFQELFGVDPLDKTEEDTASRWLHLENLGRTAKLYKFELPEEDLRVLMLLDITETVMKDQQADVLKAETINKAQQVIHQQMRVAQEIAGLLGETTAETKAALFELMKLAREGEKL